LSLLRRALRLFVLAFWLLLGLLILGLVFPWLGLGTRLRIKQQWSRILLWMCGLKVTVRGCQPARGAVLWVANHVSWLDIFVLNAVRATTFIAKHEIRSWPLIGWLVAGADTIFIERGRRHAVHRVGLEMQRRFESGQAVGLFPESKTSPGLVVLPFYANLFEPAKRSHVTIQPVALRYFHHGVRSVFASFVGEETFMGNLWRVLGESGLSVEMVFLEPLSSETVAELKRTDLAQLARTSIQDVVAVGHGDN